MPKFSKAITKESVISKSSYSSGSSVPSQMTFEKSDSGIRTVKLTEYKAAAACLADAFTADEVAAYFFECPDTTNWSPDRKWALHVKIMEVTVFFHIQFGVVHATGDPMNGGTFDSVALWMPPRANATGWLPMLTKGVLRHGVQVYFQLSKEGRFRLFKEFVPLLHSTKEEVLKDRDPESWYLVYLGTHSRARGKGLAKKLINEVSRKADLESRACYLESSNAVNVAIYRKLGFEVSKQITLHRGKQKVHLDIMVREPVPLKPVLLPRSAEQHGVPALVELPDKGADEQVAV